MKMFLVVVLSMGCLFMLCVIFSGNDENKRDPVHTMAVLKVCAEEAISSKLKSPASAKFSGIEETEYRTNDAVNFVVIGHVDAQNSFGALLRSRYVCWAHRSGDDMVCDSAKLMQ